MVLPSCGVGIIQFGLCFGFDLLGAGLDAVGLLGCLFWVVFVIYDGWVGLVILVFVGCGSPLWAGFRGDFACCGVGVV